MSKAKTTAKKAPPAAVVDPGVTGACPRYAEETGLQLRADVANVLRCRLCRWPLVPARVKDCLHCSRFLCGPLLTEQHLASLLVENNCFADEKKARAFLKEFRHEAAAAFDSRPMRSS